MALAFRGGNSASGYATSITVNSGSASPAEGDVLVLFAWNAYGSVTGTPTVDNSWSVVASTGGTQPQGITAIKAVTPAMVGVQATTVVGSPVAGTATILHGFLVLVGGGASITPDDVAYAYDGYATAAGTRRQSTSLTAPSLTATATSIDYELMLTSHCTYYGGSNAGLTMTAPPDASSFFGPAINNYTMSRVARIANITADGATGTRTATANIATYNGSVSILLRAPAPTPTAPKISTIADRFATLDTTRWPTRNYASLNTQYGAAAIEARYSGGPVYAALRSAETYTMAGGSTFSFRVRLMPEGNANAQAWVKQPDAAGVGRVGFEYRAAAGQLDLIGQGAGYASIGTTVSITYNKPLHRYLLLELTAAGVLTWYTSPDSVNWTSQRSMPAGQAPTFLTRNDLSLSFEGFRNAAGTNDAFIIDDVNLSAPAEPTWAPAMTGGTTLWAADFTQTNSILAGYKDDRWQRQTATGAMGVVDDTLLPYPVPILPAPFGRSGRALRVRLPDAHRRNEVVPDVPEWTDGMSSFVGFALFIEADTDTIADAGNFYQSVWQLRPDDSAGSPTVSVEVIEGNLELTGGSGRPDPYGGASYPWQKAYRQTLMAGVPKGVWLHIVLFIGMWSLLDSGRVDAWVNGTQVLTNFRPPGGTNFGTEGETAYPKNGLYHDGGNRGATVWFASHRHGTSYAAVDPAATILEYRDLGGNQ